MALFTVTVAGVLLTLTYCGAADIPNIADHPYLIGIGPDRPAVDCLNRLKSQTDHDAHLRDELLRVLDDLVNSGMPALSINVTDIIEKKFGDPQERMYLQKLEGKFKICVKQGTVS